MSRQERTAWDERFRAGDHASEAPDPFLARLDEYLEVLPAARRPAPGAGSAARPKALDLACGAGRNAVHLAGRGWDVTACDVSLEGLRCAQALAARRGVGLQLFCQDLESIHLPVERFDLVLCFFYLQRDLVPQIRDALCPGGLLVYKTYTTDQLRFPGRPRHATHMLRPQELLELFRGFRVLVYHEALQGRGVAHLIARKPAS